MEPEGTEHTGFAHRLRAGWIRLRTSRGSVIGMVVAALVIALLGVLAASAQRHDNPDGSVARAVPVGPRGEAVTDRFYFMHKPLAGNGTITARVTSLTGIITYPPPNHDQIVAGIMPWAKAGVIVKASTKQGSSYAAMMLTGSHGVRMQYDFTEDIAGRPASASLRNPLWLRLTRLGETLTGYESTDGAKWTEVHTAHLTGLPGTVQVGLFVTSPGDVTVSEAASRWTQATAVFDQVSLEGDAPGAWSRLDLGDDGVRTDWERHRRPAGVELSGDTFTVTGSGDIAPGAAEGPTIRSTLIGTLPGLIVVIIVAVSFGRREYLGGQAKTGAQPGRMLTAKAVVIGTVTFIAGLVAAIVALAVGKQILLANRIPILPVSAFTELRLGVGTALLLAVSALLALALGAVFRRKVQAIVLAIGVIVLPYLLALAFVLPVGPWQWDLRLSAAQWLLRLTPAAGFAIQQSIPEYPQVDGPYTPIMGYFPLSPWGGLTVLGGHTVLALGLAVCLLRRKDARVSREAHTI